MKVTEEGVSGVFGAASEVIASSSKWNPIPYLFAILLVLQVPAILQAGLDQIWNLANPATRRVAYITDIYVIRIGLMQGQYSFATAVGLIYSVVGLALTLIANRVSKGAVGHGIF